MHLPLLLFYLLVCLLPAASYAEKYQYDLAACLIFQNEGKYLKEWIEYHKLVGVDHFYLIDNGSDDGFMKVLAPYIKSGEVELFQDPTISNSQAAHTLVQCGNYEKVIAHAKGKVKWLAIIDADEFILPVAGRSIPKILKNYEEHGGLYVNWLEFGTSNVKKIPKDRLMVEMLFRCSKEPRALGKSIVRPERVSHCTDPHRLWYLPPYGHVNSDFQTFNWVAPIAIDKVVIHHYMTRDLDHLIHTKYPRRLKWWGKAVALEDYIRSLDKHNERENRAMLRFIPQLRKKMGLPVPAVMIQEGGDECKKD